MQKYSKWFWVAFVAIMLAAPNATVIRVAVNDIDPFFWTLSRFILISILMLPFVIRARAVFRSAVARIALTKASIALTVSMLSYVLAIYYSQASYVSIVTLITPILFVVLSAKIVGDKINRQSIAGVTLAAIGAMILVILPIAIHQNGIAFYPLATFYALVNCVAYSLGIIYLRKADEAGVSLPVAIGTSSIFVMIVSFVLFVLFGDGTRLPALDSYGFWAALGYSALVVALIGRALNVVSYEHVGAAVMSALTYLETLVAILIPVFFLHEQLSVEMVVGGIVILIGVYVVEYHKHPHIKHHLLHRHY